MDDPCLCTALRQAAQSSTAFYDAALAPSGLKVTMYRLLRRIEAAPGASLTTLADTIGLDRSTLGRNLRVLERQGLIALAAGTDGRAKRIDLTDEGRAALRVAVPLWRQAQTDFAALIGPDVVASLRALAGALRHAA